MRTRDVVAVLAVALMVPRLVCAHSGPPYPVVSDRQVGSYTLGIWTDPDVTDDGSPAGQFWVVVRAAGKNGSVPSETRADVSIRPTDRSGESRSRRAEPVGGDVTRQFAALLMDHEGPFAVHVKVSGPLGNAEIDTNVDATYDLRPSRGLIAVFLMPFLLVGFIWGKLILERRRGRHTSAEPRPASLHQAREGGAQRIP
jgi:hypothetical protein